MFVGLEPDILQKAYYRREHGECFPGAFRQSRDSGPLKSTFATRR
jgi:hypothetical protein